MDKPCGVLFNPVLFLHAALLTSCYIFLLIHLTTVNIGTIFSSRGSRSEAHFFEPHRGPLLNTQFPVWHDLHIFIPVPNILSLLEKMHSCPSRESWFSTCLFPYAHTKSLRDWDLPSKICGGKMKGYQYCSIDGVHFHADDIGIILLTRGKKPKIVCS